MLGNHIFTERLCLRKIEEEDLQMISDWSSSAAAYGEYLTPENHSVEECFDRWKNNSYWNEQSKTLIIERKENNKPLGTIRFWQKQNDHRAALVALKIAEADCRRQGFGTEAQLGLIHYLFTQNHCQTIEMFTDLDNVPEQRCLTKLGFSLIDIQTYEDQKVQRQGRLYRLTRIEYDQQLQGFR
jgi:RimJ/RimL family protein N-acetyltransferase